uniref:Uncharacterized protein n=1 Tax=feces metagenome TaxID=1861841 RepID=A0A2I2K943_9ZZZZ
MHFASEAPILYNFVQKQLLEKQNTPPTAISNHKFVYVVFTTILIRLGSIYSNPVLE